MKRGQFEFTKKFEMEKMALDRKRLKMENHRMLEKQRLDAEYRLAELTAQLEYQEKLMHINADLRSRGREILPTIRIQTNPPPMPLPSPLPDSCPVAPIIAHTKSS